MIPPGHPPHDPEAHGSMHEWYACLYPERPHDPDYTAYWSECPICLIALRAAVANGADLDAGLDWRTPENPKSDPLVGAPCSLRELLALPDQGRRE